MTKSEPREFDFREIAALDESAAYLRDWLSKTSSFFSDFWDAVTGYSAQLKFGKITTEPYESVLKGISKENNYSVAEIQDRFTSLWFASNQEMRSIVSDMLVQPVSEEASDEEGEEAREDDSELSPIEIAIAEMFLDGLAAAFTAGWIGGVELNVTASPLEKDPRKAILFRNRDLVSRIDIQVELRSRETQVHWIIPKQSMADLMSFQTERRADTDSKSPSESLVSSIPVEMVALIGEASIPMVELGNLRSGQLVKLDQRIDQPLTVLVNDEAFYECWPGRYGSKQSIEIIRSLRNDQDGGAA